MVSDILMAEGVLTSHRATLRQTEFSIYTMGLNRTLPLCIFEESSIVMSVCLQIVGHQI